MTIYRVEKMSCGHCTAAIEKAVKEADPGARVACDLGARTVRVESALSPAEVEQAIRGAGYEPVAA